MNKNQLQEALKAKGVTFSATATTAELQRLYDSIDLVKRIADLGGVSFDSEQLQKELQEDKENEYPDYGRDVPEGEYSICGYSTLHEWKNKRTGRTSRIRTAFITNGTDIFEMPFSAFCAREFDFVKFDGRDDSGEVIHTKVEMHPICPFISSVAERNLTVVKTLKADDKIKVCHERGHYDNPYNTRIFNFVNTWIERA